MAFTHHQLEIPSTLHNTRADKAISNLIEGVSRVYIQSIFEKNYITKNNQPLTQKDKVFAHDIIHVTLPERESTSLYAVNIPINVIYEDNDIILINKEPGLVTHPGSGTGEDTLVHALLHHTNGQLSKAGGDKRPGVVHRLDKETSGLMIFAKSDKAYLKLIEAFSTRSIQKTYTAIVQGIPRLCSGKIDAPIDRNPQCRVKMAVVSHGKPARTDWEICERFGTHTRLNLWLHTGRTHQIRVHLSHIGHPILGDKTYGWRPKLGEPHPTRVLLHAHILTFHHPITEQPLFFEAPIPEDIKSFSKTD